MRVLLDHHLSPLIAEHLHAAGHDATVAHQRGWSRLPDADLLEAAVGERRAVVTADVKDFVPLARGWAEQQRDHWGIVLMGDALIARRAGGVGRAVRALATLLDAHAADDAFRNRVHWL